jgi:preprotein translocase subunit SecA
MGYLAEAIDSTISTFCVSDERDEWDLHGLHAEIAAMWPTQLTETSLDSAHSTDDLYEIIMGEATAYYERREAEFGEDAMREVERQVMLRILDQKWREHLYEMDYLQEGINLRAMGQKDPLVEWQREGFEMFGSMMAAVATDFVTYVMHAQVTVTEQKPENQPQVSNLQYTAPVDPSEAPSGLQAAARAQAAAEGLEAPPEAQEEVVNTPTVKSEWDKTPRNAPCPCGSGKKFKLCHGV